MSTSDPSYAGAAVHDELGNTIGSVSDVIYDDVGSRPSWFVVRPGMFHGEHYVPATGAYRTADNDIVVPFDRHMIRTSPKAKGDHVLTDAERERLAQHYDVAV